MRPFHALGFERNPFGALTPEEGIRAAVLPEAVRRAAQSGAHLQILGGPGSGKTSALPALGREFRASGVSCAYEYIPPRAAAFHVLFRGG